MDKYITFKITNDDMIGSGIKSLSNAEEYLKNNLNEKE